MAAAKLSVTTGVVYWKTNLPAPPITVAALDNSDVKDTGWSGTSTIEKVSGSGSLSGTLTVAGESGDTSFTNVKYNAIGTFSFKITDDASRGGLSDSTTITVFANRTKGATS